MEATIGRDMDIFIHEQVLQRCAHAWKWKYPPLMQYADLPDSYNKVCTKCGDESGPGGFPVDGKPHAPTYSTLDVTALSILPVMRSRGLFCKITYFWSDDYGVRASFDHQGVSDPNPLYQGHGDTIAEAICRAAAA